MTLPKATGPACPNCGCRQSTVRNVKARFRGEVLLSNDSTDEQRKAAAAWMQPRVERTCGACGRKWTIRIENGSANSVPFVLVQCPQCGGTECPVTHTKRPIRRHACRDCGVRFKSYEAFSC